MATSVPTPATLNIAVNDYINILGQNYLITNVAAGVDNGLGRITYLVTCAGGRTVTVSAFRTVLAYANSAGVKTWTHG